VWWNWDPSEVFGFVIFVATVFYIHKYFWNLKITINMVDLSLILVAVSLLYYFMQLNFNLISHNFGLRGTELTNKLQLYWTISLFLLYIQFKINYDIIRYLSYGIIINITSLHNVVYNNTPKLLSSSILFLLFLLVAISYYPIILNFLLNLAGISISNVPNYTSAIITYTIVFIILNFLNPLNFNFIFIYIILLSLNLTTLNFLLIPLLFKFNYVYLNHKYIFIFILTSFINYYKHSLIWLIDSENFFWSSTFSNYLIGLQNFSINSNLIELNNGIKIINNQYILPNLGLCSLCSTSEINMFCHEITISLPTQTLINGSLLNFFLTMSYEYNLTALISISIIINMSFVLNTSNFSSLQH
jgi:hypothetical protein